jgi:hypothetical protein
MALSFIVTPTNHFRCLFKGRADLVSLSFIVTPTNHFRCLFKGRADLVSLSFIVTPTNHFRCLFKGRADLVSHVRKISIMRSSGTQSWGDSGSEAGIWQMLASSANNRDASSVDPREAAARRALFRSHGAAATATTCGHSVTAGLDA